MLISALEARTGEPGGNSHAGLMKDTACQQGRRLMSESGRCPRQFVRPVRSCRSCRQLPSNAEEQRLWSMERTMLGSISKSSTAVVVLALEKPEGRGRFRRGTERQRVESRDSKPGALLLFLSGSHLITLLYTFENVNTVFHDLRLTCSANSLPPKSSGSIARSHYCHSYPRRGSGGKIASIRFVRITVEE